MAGAIVIYWRNYDSSDTTTTSSGRYTTSDPIPTIDAIGWTAPSGYQFKEWNTARDGSGTSFQPGDTAPSNDSNKYAIWEPIPIPYLVTSTDLTSIADAIRTKGGTSAALEWPDGFVDAINAIGGGSTLYTITVIDVGAVDKNKAEEGETVTVTMPAMSPGKQGYIVTVKNADTQATIYSQGGLSASATYQFLMPAANVTITVTIG